MKEAWIKTIVFMGWRWGIGFKIDYTLLVHLVTYSLLIWPGIYLWTWLGYPQYRIGIIAAVSAMLAVETFQCWQHQFNRNNYFGIGDTATYLLFAATLWQLL